MSLPRKLVLGVALAAFLVVAIVFGRLLYRQWTRPNIDRDGGTILVYEVDPSRWPDGKAPSDYDAQKLAARLKQRLDPGDLYGITVRSAGDNRVEVSVPRWGGNAAEQVGEVKELIARAGVLELRILANTDDDKDGIETASRYFDGVRNNPAELGELRAAAAVGTPPPPPTPPDRGPFYILLGDAVTYSWIELGPAERHRYGLANDQETNPFWQEMAEARKDHKAVLHTDVGGVPYRTHLFYSREVVNLDRLPEKGRGKKYEYFVLCRGPARDEDGNPKALTGDLLVSADPTKGTGRDEPAVGFTFNSRGAMRLGELTTQNKGRQMAIVLDDVIQSAPNIQTPITGGRGIITGNYTKEDVDRMVNILRSGALPATLKPEPFSETTVEPKK